MLFNSQEFLFAFLPATLLLTWVALRLGGRDAGIAILTLASLVFYAWWDLNDLAIIIASIAFNYACSVQLSRLEPSRLRRLTLLVGIGGNLAALAYFKYANFGLAILGEVTGSAEPLLAIALPLAISFYTFQQIAFLVDGYRRRMERVPLLKYVASVVFFPHLIAGPLLHYNDIVARFAGRFRVGAATLSAGVPIFAVGLAKKVGVADPLSQFVAPLFETAETVPLEFFEAWGAALGYTAQLYFDFSGYSDMAIGLGLMFGIALPINFLSPYKSRSIIEFWRRWHMTLSAFLRDHLYFPLGGSRRGEARKYANLLIVMALGGLWHGAGWTFVVWGLLHGSALAVNHLWVAHVHNRMCRIAVAAIGPALTFGFVVIAWVFFRAETFAGASNILSGMLAPQAVGLPRELAGLWPLAAIPGITWGSGFGDAPVAPFLFYLVVAYAVIFFAANTTELFGTPDDRDRAVPRLTMRSVLAATALFWLAGFGVFGAAPTEFLYFQF